MASLYAAYLRRRTRVETKQMIRAARRSKEIAMSKPAYHCGADECCEGDGYPDCAVVKEATPNPCHYDDDHTGPLVIVTTD